MADAKRSAAAGCMVGAAWLSTSILIETMV
jgi:hypothetical protein